MYTNLLALPLTLLAITTLTTAQQPASSPVPTPAPTGAPRVGPTDSTPQQTSAFNQALQSYLSSLKGSPQYTQLAINLGLNVPGPVLASLQANPSALVPLQTPVDIKSLATAPPLTFATQTWEATLPPGVESSLKAVQTSVALEAAQIAQSAVSTSASISVPPAPKGTASSSGSASRPTGLAGAAAVGMGLVAGVGVFVL